MAPREGYSTITTSSQRASLGPIRVTPASARKTGRARILVKIGSMCLEYSSHACRPVLGSVSVPGGYTARARYRSRLIITTGWPSGIVASASRTSDTVSLALIAFLLVSGARRRWPEDVRAAHRQPPGGGPP